LKRLAVEALGGTSVPLFLAQKVSVCTGLCIILPVSVSNKVRLKTND
jgi:hypothetical protein